MEGEKILNAIYNSTQNQGILMDKSGKYVKNLYMEKCKLLVR